MQLSEGMTRIDVAHSVALTGTIQVHDEISAEHQALLSLALDSLSDVLRERGVHSDIWREQETLRRKSDAQAIALLIFRAYGDSGLVALLDWLRESEMLKSSLPELMEAIEERRTNHVAS